MQVIENNGGMGPLLDDSIGHTTTAATLLPVSGTTVDYMRARGIIEPASSSSPNPTGVGNYTKDLFSFASTGGAVSLTVHNGSERITPGVADGGATLSSVLSILDTAGNVLYSAPTDYSTLSATITQTLSPGSYYAQISSTGGESGTFDVTTNYYYDMGSYFLTGSGVVSTNTGSFYWTGGASTAKWSQVDGATSNWRTDHANGTDPAAGPSGTSNVYFTADSNATNLTTTLGGDRTINSLNFTGTGTTAGTTPVTIAADGSTLTLAANGGYIDATGTAYAPGTGLVVQPGSASHTIAANVALGASQTWQIKNAATAPLTVSGTISGAGDMLTVTGAGKLILAHANTYTGGTTIQGGTVSFVTGALGTGGVTLTNGGLLQFATGNAQDITTLGPGLTVGAGGGQLDTNGNSVTFNGNILGPAAGPLSKLGAGTLTINGSANPANLFVRAGTVSLGTAASVSTATTPVSGANNYSSIGQFAGDNGTLTLNGSAVFTNAGELNVADVNATGVLNVLGSATVNARSLEVGKFGNANGTVNQSGGTVTEADNGAGTADWRIGGYGSAADAAAVGVYNLSAGTLNTGAANLQVGAYGKGTVTQTGGTATVAAYLSIGRFGGGNGTWDLSTGTGALVANTAPLAIVGEQGTGVLKVGGSSTVTAKTLAIGFGNGAIGTVTQTGGTITAATGVSFGGGNAAGGAASSGTFTLTSGTLATASVTQQPGTGVTGTFNFNGGTLRATASNVSLMSGITNAKVQAGGALINTNGNTASLDQTLVHDTALGVTVDGGLTKSGSGILLVAAPQSYTGPTSVGAGTLRLSAAPTAPLSGAVAWFDASDASTITAASGVVTGWANKGTAGNALNAAQTVAGVGPTVTTPAGVVGGKSVLTFANLASGLVTAGNLGITGNQDRTLFVVGDRATGSSMFFAHEGPVGTANAAYGISSETASAYLYTWANDVTFPARTAGAFEIYDSELTTNGTALTGNVLGGNVLSSSSKTVAANTTNSPLYVGDRPTNTSGGDVAEVIEYAGALTAAQRSAVEAYLNYKWFGMTAAPVTNRLPTTTALNLTAAAAILDLNGINQTVGSLTGVNASAITLGGATFTVGNSTSTTFAGSVTGAGSVVVQGTGTLTLAGLSTFNGTLTVNNGATVTVTSAGTLPSATPLLDSGVINLAAPTSGGIRKRTDAAITVNNGAQLNLLPATVHTNRTLLVASALTLNGTAKVDVANNDMDIQNGDLAAITAAIATGFAGGAWNGNGISSSTAAGDSTHLTAVGAILNGSIYGTAGALGLFDGSNPAPADVLVKYTYYGDANLDGMVDGSDYTLIDAAFGTGLTGWINGDFNYDRTIDGSDYTLIDNAFNTQGGNLSTTAEGLLAVNTAQLAVGSSSFPEPSGALVVLALGAGCLLGRRRAAPAFSRVRT